MTKDEALKLALEELADRFSEGWHEGIKIDASDIMLLSKAAEALAQPEQEPVMRVKVEDGCWMNTVSQDLHRLANGEHDLYTATPQRTWVDLTNEDWYEIFGNALTIGEAIKVTEAKLKEKNT